MVLLFCVGLFYVPIFAALEFSYLGFRSCSFMFKFVQLYHVHVQVSVAALSCLSVLYMSAVLAAPQGPVSKETVNLISRDPQFIHNDTLKREFFPPETMKLIVRIKHFSSQTNDDNFYINNKIHGFMEITFFNRASPFLHDSLEITSSVPLINFSQFFLQLFFIKSIYIISQNFKSINTILYQNLVQFYCSFTQE